MPEETPLTKPPGKIQITSLGVYKHLLPVATEILKIISSRKTITQNHLWQSLENSTIESVSQLSIGYNNYHLKNKRNYYEKVRNNISEMQANILLLTHLEEMTSSTGERLSMQLEECIRASGSLIKTMEQKTPEKPETEP